VQPPIENETLLSIVRRMLIQTSKNRGLLDSIATDGHLIKRARGLSESDILELLKTIGEVRKMASGNSAAASIGFLIAPPGQIGTRKATKKEVAHFREQIDSLDVLSRCAKFAAIRGFKAFVGIGSWEISHQELISDLKCLPPRLRQDPMTTWSLVHTFFSERGQASNKYSRECFRPVDVWVVAADVKNARGNYGGKLFKLRLELIPSAKAGCFPDPCDLLIDHLKRDDLVSTISRAFELASKWALASRPESVSGLKPTYAGTWRLMEADGKSPMSIPSHGPSLGGAAVHGFCRLLKGPHVLPEDSVIFLVSLTEDGQPCDGDELRQKVKAIRDEPSVDTIVTATKKGANLVKTLTGKGSRRIRVVSLQERLT